jgi:hypothetical protein
VTLGAKNTEHKIAKFNTLVEGPSDRHGSGIDKKSKIQHYMRDERIPFVVAETALTAIFMRKAEEDVSGTNALMESGAHLVAIACYAVVIDESSIGKA